MKRTITIFMACVLILSCLVGCSSNKQPEIEATLNPTETLVSPTEEVTEAPTEAVELTEEEKTQLKYEKMFTDGTYIMDWSCVTIDVNTNYYVELFGDENGIFWESLRSMAEDPHYIYSYYFYRRNENTAYCFTNFLEDKDGDYDTSDFYYVDVNSTNNGNIVNSTVEEMQNLFANFLSRKKELTYVETDDAVIITIDCGSLDSLICHVDPNTSEVKKLYIINYDKTYYIEFVSKTVDDVILKVDDLPFKITQTITFADIQNHREEMAIEIASHMCERSEWVPSAFIAAETLPEEEQKQKQEMWGKIFADKTYSLNWDSIKMEYELLTYVERLSDENGVYWEALSTLENDTHPHYSYLYRVDADTAYHSTQTPGDGNKTYLVDMTSQYSDYDSENIIYLCWLYAQDYFEDMIARQKEMLYKGTKNGADIIKINCGPIETLILHIDPSTYEVRKLIIVRSTLPDEAIYVEFVPDSAAKKVIDIPATIDGTVTLKDVNNYRNTLCSEILTHSCLREWYPFEEKEKQINGEA